MARASRRGVGRHIMARAAPRARVAPRRAAPRGARARRRARDDDARRDALTATRDALPIRDVVDAVLDALEVRRRRARASNAD